jgi:phosphoglycerate kinase
MKTIDQFNFSGLRVLVRVDFNVPLDKEQRITDDTRIRAALPTLRKILEDGGSIVLMSHLGRPLKKLKEDGTVDRKKFSLAPVAVRCAELLGRAVQFTADCIGDEALSASGGLAPGQVLLLENLRFYKEEEKGDSAFARQLAAHGQFYVNDAFGTAHRAHASTAVIAQFFPGKKCFGRVMADELRNADRVLQHAEKPFTAVLGGAKVSDKILILERLIDKVDHLLVGGGMAFTFIKAMNGRIGTSLVEADKLDLALRILELAKQKGVQLTLPVDVIAADRFDAGAATQECPADAIPDGWMGLDIGAKTRQEFSGILRASRTILWNGPAGVFEMAPFAGGTRAVAEAIAAATAAGAFSLIGGGDSAAAIHHFGLGDKVSYVSTGGGALLEYVEGKTLPGVAAIND